MSGIGRTAAGLAPTAAFDRGCVKTLEALMVKCIFGHLGSISRDFVDLNRALSNLHGM